MEDLQCWNDEVTQLKIVVVGKLVVTRLLEFL
jgi:hypothetical protein